MRGNITNTGYKRNSKDKNNDFNIIPSNTITMDNVEHPVLGISDTGHKQMMYPNNDYKFNGNSVIEFPIKNKVMTKQQMLKLAGTKDEKSFYAKYPTEVAFFKAHPEAKKLIKAQNGTIQGPENMPTGNYYQDTNPYFANNPGQTGLNNPAVASPPSKFNLSPSMVTGALSSINGIVNAFSSERKQKDKLRQENKLLGLTEELTNRPDVNIPLQKHVLDRPENYITSTNSFYPSKGTGYDILSGVGKNGLSIKKAQEGFVQGMGTNEDQYDYSDISSPTSIPDNLNSTPGGMMGRPSMIPEESAQTPEPTYTPIENFDSNSARDTWVHKTGLPWSEAKKLGYTTGAAKDNIKLLAELNDPRFKKENIRKEVPKNSSQSRTPIQHTDTPTGRLTPIKKPLTVDEFFKGKPSYKYKEAEVHSDSHSGYDRELEAKRNQAEHDDYLLGELPLYYMAHPSKLIGDIKNLVNPEFTKEDETSKGYKKEIMANRYNPNQTKSQRTAEHLKKGIKLIPRATVNAATAIAATPYTTFEAMPTGISQGAGLRAAGYLGKGVEQIGAGTPLQLGEGYIPNFTMYKSGGNIPFVHEDIDSEIYTNNDFTPLNDFENIKQYADGGIFSAEDISGFSEAMGNHFDNNAGYQTGNFAGQFIPIPGANLATGMIGGALDNMFGDAGSIKSYEKMNQHKMNNIMGNSMWKNIPDSPFRKEGGNVNPQIITRFNNLTADDIYDFAHEGMDSLRSGGHLKDPRYTPISERGLETFATGGELKTHWGGEVNPVSYNPFSEGEGLTYNASGNSHFEKDSQGRTGIGLSVLKDGGDTNEPDVEIETNEPISITKNGAVVYGKLNANGDFLEDFNLPDEFAGKQIKHIVNNIIVPKEKRAMDALAKIKASSASNTSFGLLNDKTSEIRKKGLENQLKNYAEQKKGLADLQEFVKNTTDHFSQMTGKEISQEKFAKNGTISHVLAKGEIPQAARNGKTLHKAQVGDKIKTDDMTKEEAIKKGYKLEDDGHYHLRTKEEAAKPIVSKAAIATKDIPRQHKNASGLYGNITPEQFEEYKKRNDWYVWTRFDPNNPEHVGNYEDAFNSKAKEYGSDARIGDQGDSKQRGLFGQQDYSANINMNKNNPTTKETDQIANIISDADYSPLATNKKKFPWGAVINNALGMFDKPFNMPLDKSQINPELYSMANNSVEGVYEPHAYSMMKTPFKYSANADRDAILSQARTATKNAGNNPAAQAAIMAQVADSMNQIGSKELGVNQQTEQGVYNENIGTHNQDLVRNSTIDMDVMNKYAEAKSKTKAQTIEDLKSIAAKQAANKEENMKYNVAQAMFPDYTFNSSGQLVKKPRYIEFDTTGKNTPTGKSTSNTAPEGFEFLYDTNGNVKSMKPKKEDAAREGKTIKAKAQNGNIIKAFKNL